MPKPKKHTPNPLVKLSPFELGNLTLKKIDKIRQAVPDFGKLSSPDIEYHEKIMLKESELGLKHMLHGQWVEDWEYSSIAHDSISILNHIFLWNVLHDTDIKHGDLGREIEYNLFPEEKDWHTKLDEIDRDIYDVWSLHQSWKNPSKDAVYFLLHSYIIFRWHEDSKFQKYINLENYLKWFAKHQKRIDFNELKALIKKHPANVSVVGLTKKTQQDLFPMTVGKWKTELVKDYIKLAKEDLKLPIDEERVLDMANRSFSFEDFWYMYGSMNLPLYEYYSDGASHERNIFLSALDRFRENVSDDEEVVMKILMVLFNDYANNKDWKDKQTELDLEEGEGLFHASDIGAMKHGYGAIRFAERMYHGTTIMDGTTETGTMLHFRGKEELQDEFMNAWESVLHDWNDYCKNDDDKTFGTYIKEKYFNS